MEKFTAGLLLGSIVGAVAVANSYKMRTLVKKGQEEMKLKLDEMIDDKLEMLEKMAQKAQASMEEKISNQEEPSQKTPAKKKKA